MSSHVNSGIARLGLAAKTVLQALILMDSYQIQVLMMMCLALMQQLTVYLLAVAEYAVEVMQTCQWTQTLAMLSVSEFHHESKGLFEQIRVSFNIRGIKDAV